VIEVDNRPAPKFLAQFLSGYQLSPPFEEHGQDLKRLFLQSDAQTALRRPRFVSSPARRSTSKAPNRNRLEGSLASRIADTG
jgi:hypothetical protein